MTAPIQPRALVSSPPPVEPSRYGLLSVTDINEGGDGRWQLGGVEYDSDNCTHSGTVDGSCPILTPLPPLDQEATVTLAAQTLTPPAVEADLTITTTALGTAPETYSVTVVSGADSVATIVVAIPGAGGNLTVAPGETKTTTTGLEAGSVTATFTSPAGTPTPATVEVTLPLGAPLTPVVSVQPAATYTYTASSAADSDFPVTLTSAPAGVAATVAPGDTTAAAAIAADTYTVTATGPGVTTPVTGDFVVPGADVDLTVVRQIPNPDPPDSSHDKPLAEGINTVEGHEPFTVYNQFECNPVGMGEDVHERARRRLRLSEWRAVEQWHWDRMLQALADGDIADWGTADPGVDFKEGLGNAEMRARAATADSGSYNGLPTLHVPLFAWPYFAQQEVIYRDGDVMRTSIGSKVAFYTGYSFTPGDPIGTFLVFITGAMRAFRGEVFSNEAMEIPTNTRSIIAERTWALDHDCFAAAIRLSLVGVG